MAAAPLAPPSVPEPLLPSADGSGRVPILVEFPCPAKQNRLTVGFRLILAIPHFVVLFFLAIAALVVLVIGWFGALFTGRLSAFAADFLAGYLRWQTRLYGYLLLLTDVYPPFSLADDPRYPIHVGIQPGRLNRLAVLFRIILGFPAWFMGLILADSLYPVGFAAWLIVLVRGTMPRPLHQAIAAVVRYQARVSGYMTLLTAEYPWGLFGDFAAIGTLPLVLPQVGESGAGMPHVIGDLPPGVVAETGGGFVAPPSPGWPEAPGAVPAAAPPVDQSSTGPPPATAPEDVESAGSQAPGAAAPDPVPVGEGLPAAAPSRAGAPTELTRWELILSIPERWLLGVFIVLGLAVAFASGTAYQRGYTPLPSFGLSIGTVSRAEAINEIQAAHDRLDTDVRIFEQTAASCQSSAQPLRCITAADGRLAAAFGSFSRKVRDAAMPSGSSATAANRLADQATQVQRDLTRVAASTSLGQYQQLLQTVGIDQALHQFDQDYHNLGKALGAV